MARAMISCPNYLTVLPNGGIKLVCYELMLNKWTIDKIANNKLLTCNDFPNCRDFNTGGLMGRFTIREVVIKQGIKVRFYKLQKWLIEAMLTNTSITHLDMSNTVFENDTEAIELFQTISMNNTTIQSIKLSNTNLKNLSPSRNIVI
jgi:hypothetical protein